MRKELIAELGGVDPALIEGAVHGEPAGGESATRDKPAGTSIAIDPAKQFEILNPKAIDLRCEMFYLDWYCDADTPHRATQDERPLRCASCGSRVFAGPIERLDVTFYQLRLSFTELQIHRKKVFERIEHYAQICFAEMLRHHNAPQLDAEWIRTHPGYFEAAIVSPQARQVLRELLEFLNPEQGGLVSGMSDAAQTMAALAIVRCRTDRLASIAENASKKAMAGAQG